MTSIELSLRPIRIARHARVNSSMTLSMRSLRPSLRGLLASVLCSGSSASCGRCGPQQSHRTIIRQQADDPFSKGAAASRPLRDMVGVRRPQPDTGAVIRPLDVHHP